MATAMGPIPGDDVHEALANTLLRIGIFDISATLSARPDLSKVWLCAVTSDSPPGIRVLLAQGDDGWAVVISAPQEPESLLLMKAQRALKRWAKQRTDAVKEIRN